MAQITLILLMSYMTAGLAATDDAAYSLGQAATNLATEHTEEGTKDGMEGTLNGMVGGQPSTHSMLTEPVTQQDPCVSLCSCDMTAQKVDCSARALNSVPIGLPVSLRFLDLSGNNISYLQEFDLSRYSQLEQLDLSYNNLGDISASVFMYSTSLQSLYLQHNHLNEEFFYCSHEVVSDGNDTLGNYTAVGLCNVSSLLLLDLTNNELDMLPSGILDSYPHLEVLLLDYNQLRWLPQLSSFAHPLQHLSLTYNWMIILDCDSVTNLSRLHHLNLGYNQLHHVPPGVCTHHLHGLTILTLSGNPFKALSPRAFSNMTNLSVLYLTNLQGLRYLPEHAFSGLPHLKRLILNSNPNLAYIHAGAFSGLVLEVLDLCDCGLAWLHQDVLRNLTVRDVRLAGNSWSCDCDLEWLATWLLTHSPHHNIVCTDPVQLYGHNLLNASITLDCQLPQLVDQNITQKYRIGHAAVVDCLEAGQAKTRVMWKTPKGVVLEYEPGYHHFYRSDPSRPGYHATHDWHQDTAYHPTLDYSERIRVLYNGSLYLDYFTRTDTGLYTCYTFYEEGNQTALIRVMVDTQIEWFKVYSIIIGYICALIFFTIAMVTAGIYYSCVRCSTEERNKRKSIREVLSSIHDFKTVQIDRLVAYKTAKLNKLSAYKNAKIHKLVAFKSAKIGKLRNYKQVTVASIFHHVEKMREHYNTQMNRVRDNCSQQMEKLRENYTSQVDKIKDYKVDKMDRIRDNYHAQTLRIRDYRSNQLDKLRDQYKLQQQHLLKLMELLDIGNCLNVVEAECMRTESMIFNPDITFDLEAEPVHVQRGLDLSDDESEYMTAGSQSDMSVADNTFDRSDHLHDTSYRSHHRDRGLPSFMCDSISQYSSDTSLHHHSTQADTEPPPFPNFHCDIPELDDQPLEQLVSDVEEAAELYAELDQDPESLARYLAGGDGDDISMYQTPPTSSHNNMANGRGEVVCQDLSPTTSVYHSPRHSTEHLPDALLHRLHKHSKKETIV